MIYLSIGAILEINQIIVKNGGLVNQTRGSTISVAAPVVDYNQTVAPGPSSDMVNNTIALVHAPQPDLSQPPPSHIGRQTVPASIASQQVMIPCIELFIVVLLGAH